MIERRLNQPFQTKLPLRGPTWDYFFESVSGHSSRSIVFEYCQERPRDVLTYCSFAIEAAQARKHEHVVIEDLQAARKRFSDSRLKDLGDEYQENYPQLALVLSRFYGLGTEFTISGIEDLVKKLMVDQEVKSSCSSWLYQYTAPERFLEMLYNIGFIGIKEGNDVHFRSLGARSATPPAISATAHGVIHPSYRDALNLREVIIGSLDEDVSLRSGGMLAELPGALSVQDYRAQVSKLEGELIALELGKANAGRYEDIIGEVITLCFYHSLNNLEAKVREVDRCVIRDWIAANVARSGFWEMVRQRYEATQVIWECKNYRDLKADDFQQAAYYMNRQIGRFVVIVYRGTEIDKHYYEHIKRIANDKNGMILLLHERDVKVFIRQARNGKVRDDHISGIYDRILRAIS
jgi:hypothetical protein